MPGVNEVVGNAIEEDSVFVMAVLDDAEEEEVSRAIVGRLRDDQARHK